MCMKKGDHWKGGRRRSMGRHFSYMHVGRKDRREYRKWGKIASYFLLRSPSFLTLILFLPSASFSHPFISRSFVLAHSFLPSVIFFVHSYSSLHPSFLFPYFALIIPPFLFLTTCLTMRGESCSDLKRRKEKYGMTDWKHKRKGRRWRNRTNLLLFHD